MMVVYRTRKCLVAMNIPGKHFWIGFTTTSRLWSRRLLPIFVGLCVVLITLFSWQALRAENDRAIERTTSAQVEAIQLTFEARLGNRLRAIDRMGEQWESRGGVTKAQWEFEASLNVRDFPGFQALEWVDPTYHVRWVVPADGNDHIINVDLSTEERRRAALEAATSQRTMSVTQPIDLVQGGKGFLSRRIRIILTGNAFTGRAHPDMGRINESSTQRTTMIISTYSSASGITRRSPITVRYGSSPLNAIRMAQADSFSEPNAMNSMPPVPFMPNTQRMGSKTHYQRAIMKADGGCDYMPSTSGAQETGLLPSDYTAPRVASAALTSTPCMEHRLLGTTLKSIT